MDDEEDLDLLDQDGTLASLLESSVIGNSSPEAVRYSLDYLDKYQREGLGDDGPEAALLENLRKSAEARKAVLARARETLLRQRYNPGEALLAASEALGRPTRGGTLAEVMSNVSGALREPLSRKSEFGRQRDQAIAELDLQAAGLNDPVTAAELQLAQLNRRLAGSHANKALEVLRGSGRNTNRTLQIQSLMTQLLGMGVEPQEAFFRASNITDGIERMEIVPELGIATITDKLGRTVREIPIGDAQAQPPPSSVPAQPRRAPGLPQAALPPGRDPSGAPSEDVRDQVMPGRMTLWEAANAGTGLWSGIGAGWNMLAGNVGLPISTDTEQARQSIRNGVQRMLRALSVDPDDPAAREIDRIREEINILPTVANNPPVFHERLRAIDVDLRDQYRRAIADANDETLGVDLRRQRETLAAEIRNFLPNLGVPMENDGDVPVPPGIPPDIGSLWQFMSPRARELAIQLHDPSYQETQDGAQ